ESDRAASTSQGTNKGRNQWENRVWIRLGVIRVHLTEDGTDVLDKRVLEAAASAEEGNAPFAGRADGGEYTVHADVGTAGNAPEAVQSAGLAHGVVVPSGGSHPGRSNGLAQEGRSAFQGAGDRPVSRHFSAVIAH